MQQPKQGFFRRFFPHLIVLAVLVGVLILSLNFPNSVPEDYVPKVHSSFWALMPPLVAITLAFITKEVYSSLFMGILVGAFLYAGGNGELALNTMLFHEEGGLIAGITDGSHARILVFVILLATLVVLMNRSGGATAFGRWAGKRIKTRAGAQMATALLGILIFVDDGFNCMTVGSVMRPITDTHKVSRAKLAYIIDSTAAPICIIAPISCWAAAVSYSIPAEYEINGFQMFLHTIPYNLYALVTLLMVFLLAKRGLDFGKMRLHEQRAAAGEGLTLGETPYFEEVKDPVENGRLSNLLIPVVTLIVTCILAMAYTGGGFSGTPFLRSFEEADSASALVMGSLITLLITLWLYMARGVITFKSFMESFAAGFRSFSAPMIILVLSWNLSGLTGLLGADSFVHGVVESSAASLQIFIPFIVFLFSVFLAFSTGTSWGTFTILIPIVCAIFPVDSEMLVLSVAACLSGAVCGDHCSPISDTTIMSSAGAQCNHMDHVSTQLPYALTAAAVSGVGYLIAGLVCHLSGSAVTMLVTPLAMLLMVFVLMFIRKAEAKKG
ncbi:MAG: Na+/H+ antiporter NhaC family protein [Lachnospiraceae bacterium]|nr:Na+/H+ antiporter NhaC family protein [Lachnospiraceae bacterium]